ncbi:MAG: A/G-specific adenine glycosylase [Bacteroidales bacterium]|nr:A/G-specific adenine glycosylase [Bacteroidales bacterium]
MDFTRQLLDWYSLNKRELPWRNTTNPYRIWVSEVILQQTRVEQGTGYYLAFTERFPDIFALAQAPEQEVLWAWQGLGYYSRARNLHLTARHIAAKCQGVFPDDYQSLISLKGIGDYIASAILSFAFALPFPVVDGNVSRLVTRFAGWAEPLNSPSLRNKMKPFLRNLMEGHDPGLFNQAIMEFGALQCKPVNPSCHSCIFNEKCHAFQNDRVGSLPVRLPRDPPPYLYYNYILARSVFSGKAHILIRKRISPGIWRNLYDLPLIEASRLLDVREVREIIRKGSTVAHPPVTITGADYQHKLTHRIIRARFFDLDLTGFGDINAAEFLGHLNGSLTMVSCDAMERYPLPRLIERFLVDCGCLKK